MVGFGGMMRSIQNKVVHATKEAVEVGKQAVGNVGAQVARAVLEGRDFKDALQKPDGTDIDKTLDIGVVNNVGHSLIKRFDVKLNDTSVGEPTDLYHYKAYDSNLRQLPSNRRMVYGRDHRRQDEQFHHGDYTLDGNGNGGADTEQASREVHFTIQPAVDVFQSGRYLVPGLSIVIQIDFNDPQFVLMAAAGSTARFKITSAVFRVRHVKVQAAVHLEVEDKQYKQQQTVLYPIRTSKPIRRTLEAGKSFVSFTCTDLFQQSVPDRLTIGFVKSTAFNGAYNENPYMQLQVVGLKDLRMVVNGTERPINRIEFKSHDGVEGYDMMFSSTGNMHRGFSNGIKRKDYAHGNALLCINLTPDGKDAKNYTYKKNEGTLDLFLNFKQPLTDNLTVLFLPEFENEVLVDPNKVVLILYLIMEGFDPRLKTPSNLQVVGPSKSGKTH
ncbi:hypothetical protein QZH41_020551 [Actinostola sp. cb2023]|nr:hypothetical protein QZH41_020551 [Actinostola sp. cb2023]